MICKVEEEDYTFWERHVERTITNFGRGMSKGQSQILGEACRKDDYKFWEKHVERMITYSGRGLSKERLQILGEACRN